MKAFHMQYKKGDKVFVKGHKAKITGSDESGFSYEGRMCIGACPYLHDSADDVQPRGRKMREKLRIAQIENAEPGDWVVLMNDEDGICAGTVTQVTDEIVDYYIGRVWPTTTLRDGTVTARGMLFYRNNLRLATPDEIPTPEIVWEAGALMRIVRVPSRGTIMHVQDLSPDKYSEGRGAVAKTSLRPATPDEIQSYKDSLKHVITYPALMQSTKSDLQLLMDREGHAEVIVGNERWREGQVTGGWRMDRFKQIPWDQVEFDTTTNPSGKPYPKLMKSLKSGGIYYMTDANWGTLIRKTDLGASPRPEGFTGEWQRHNLVDYTGEIKVK